MNDDDEPLIDLGDSTTTVTSIKQDPTIMQEKKEDEEDGL